MGKTGDGAEKQDVTPVGGVDHRVPTWSNFVTHAAYDGFWQNQAVVPHIDRVTVPTLNVSGWWDQEDFYGAITIYEALAKHDPNHFNYLVVGPWNHGGWDSPTGEKFGPLDFGSQTSLYFRKQNIEAPCSTGSRTRASSRSVRSRPSRVAITSGVPSTAGRPVRT